ncbi:hypothetical protein CPB84DRAFT_1201244 [Gymnopilus junonius]|uniref:Uncharacterized protein n=1 Tax=Gymnopilus junonius TaxID=109634 RepID=A0A9P5NIW9_GYMJU|nr:hypothetical protein CPB84DRAFT_1201244 [Gymnopilus junonius]
MKGAQALLDASLFWKAAKTYPSGMTFIHLDYNEKTRQSQTWHCIVRQVLKDEVSFTKLWSKLGRNKAWNQQSYVAGIDKVTRVEYISEWQSIWTTLFIHPPPISPRVYTGYQVSWLHEFSHRRRGPEKKNRGYPSDQLVFWNDETPRRTGRKMNQRTLRVC